MNGADVHKADDPAEPISAGWSAEPFVPKEHDASLIMSLPRAFGAVETAQGLKCLAIGVSLREPPGIGRGIGLDPLSGPPNERRGTMALMVVDGRARVRQGVRVDQGPLVLRPRSHVNEHAGGLFG